MVAEESVILSISFLFYFNTAIITKKWHNETRRCGELANRINCKRCGSFVTTSYDILFFTFEMKMESDQLY